MNMFEQTQEQPKKPFAELPSSIRGLVACRVCARIKTVSQFADTGCESCYEDITNGRKVCAKYFGHDEQTQLMLQDKMLQEILTPNFEGVVCIMDTDKSWVARWQGCSTLRPGAYAQKVNEEPGPNLKQDLEHNNVDWITKQQSIVTATMEDQLK